MEALDEQQYSQLLQSAPGGVAKIALDDMLTLLYATDKFISMIKKVSDRASVKLPASLLRMVYSAEVINLTQQLANEKQRKDNMINFHFRVLQQDGSFRWLMISGSRTEESYISGSKTVPVYCCSIVDVTYLMVEYKKLEQTCEYHRVISELAKELFFEYEIAGDRLTFSEQFREIFGKENAITGFRKKLEKTSIIHESELPAVVSIFNSMMNGRKQVRFELRLIGKDGIPTWYTCYASIIFDDNRNPYKVVGKVSTMTIVAKEEEHEIYTPQLDTVSNVCTRASAEIMLKEAAESQAEDAVSALIMIDIRNFKGINEVRSRIDGENIMTSVGRVLKSMFRTSDIIGRLSLSEFVVYIKNVPSDRMVYEKADQLCKAIEGIHSYVHTRNGLVASMGITMHQGPADHKQLMANASTALVMAKKVPTSSFEVFSGSVS
ncbi:MAG TPA: diguanylate cyclase [Clostridiales bacterium]|nr:diguanylate cyclase [Clostridiales bacterium]